MVDGVNLMYIVSVWKCYNDAPTQLIYANKNVKK
jgi:hypothetical protein